MHHGNTGEKTFAELKEMVKLYNRESAKTGKTAYVEEVEDNDLTAYLFRKAAERTQRNKDEVQYAIGCIEAAMSAVQGLE